jgi:predicted site-specific integrase-resolvase
MTKFMKLRQASQETGISQWALKQYCKQGKIRYNLSGQTNIILRLDWLEEDLARMAVENMTTEVEENSNYGKLRKIEL